MKLKIVALLTAIVGCAAISSPTWAQAPTNYGPMMGTKTIGVEGAITDINHGDDTTGNITGTFGYFVSKNVELGTGLGLNFIPKAVTGGSTETSGFFTPSVSYHFILSDPKTVPYVSAGAYLPFTSHGSAGDSGYILAVGSDFFVKPQQSLFVELNDVGTTGHGSTSIMNVDFGLRFWLP